MMLVMLIKLRHLDTRISEHRLHINTTNHFDITEHGIDF